MKIIFDSEQEERDFINKIKDKNNCPGRIGLQENCVEDGDDDVCFECWKQALKSEVKEQ